MLLLLRDSPKLDQNEIFLKFSIPYHITEKFGKCFGLVTFHHKSVGNSLQDAIEYWDRDTNS